MNATRLNSSTLPQRVRRLRVAHVVQSLQIGGLERMVLGLARATAASVDTLVIATHDDGPVHDELIAVGAEVVVLGRAGGLQPTLPWAIASAARRFRADVLHSHHLGPFLYTAPARVLLGIPHVHTEHSHEFYDTRRHRLIGKAMGTQATLVACSASVAAFHATNFGAAAVVIANGVTVPAVPETQRVVLRAQLGLSHDDVVVGCVARLAPEKDHATLLRAFAALHETRTKLVLVGDGPERSRLIALAQELGINDRVLFLGARNDAADLWPAFDVAALSSRREGLPLALLEALAHSVPFVATAVGEVVALPGGNVVDVGDVGAFAQSLSALVSQPEQRKRLGAVGRAGVIERYSATVMASAYARIWQEVT